MTSDKKEIKKNANSYMKYSGMAMQLLVLMLIAVNLGGWLDKKYELQDGWFTILFVILFFFGWFYSLYKDLIKD